jgi:hypothetical protein
MGVARGAWRVARGAWRVKCRFLEFLMQTLAQAILNSGLGDRVIDEQQLAFCTLQDVERVPAIFP